MPAISEKIVASLPTPKAGNKVHFFSGATLQGKEAPGGFGVRCTAGGSKSFVWFHRVEGKKHLETLGQWEPKAGGLTVYDAIAKCIDRRKAIAKGVDKKGNDVDPRPGRTIALQDGDKPDGLKIGGAWRSKDDPEGENKDQPEPGLLDIFIERYARKEAKLRSADLIQATFARLVHPEIGDLGVYEIRRSHIVSMLDEIADENGPVMADRTLAYVRKAFNWYATRDDEFNSPIVKGMARTKPKERNRKRTLADDEIRDVWAGLETIEDPACYPRFVKSLLLCATRRNESSRLHTGELEDDLWTIPGARYKTKLDHVVPLTKAALALIGGKPAGTNSNSWFVFSTTHGAKPFSGFSKAKVELDKAIADIRTKAGRAPMPPWVLHDLRRTARSLMSRAKVPTDHAERALGHVMGGVRETYDRHEYLDEKRAAFEALATLVSMILNPTANIEQLATRRGKA
jgi:integrase